MPSGGSKWADVMQIVAFDEASKDAFSEAAFEFRMLMIHYTSLMHACALIDMRSDDTLMPCVAAAPLPARPDAAASAAAMHSDAPWCRRAQGVMPITREDPFLFRPNTTTAINAAVRRERAPPSPAGSGAPTTASPPA